ncbi:hypothetical protein [Saccharothrix sp.]|uniref:hypothetical protein n=1 Tax=Saccharothrix sp. TaxID=1873460 RepID=UPI00281260FC|nr:hypothetical protein [Saccharothrix sp.]
MLGALLVMPPRLSVTADPMTRDMVFHLGRDQWWSLLGHVPYGITGAVAPHALRTRSA